mmetsp:Transcript_37819/g.121303  ORF Transcript_37819/g.121303 Transcript_37819/m.121303 type:complete len:306 (+) Transcript_37819:890-1807(+)
MARLRRDVCTMAIRSTPATLSILPASLASSRPRLVRSGSAQPVKILSWLKELCPCRSSTSAHRTRFFWPGTLRSLVERRNSSRSERACSSSRSDSWKKYAGGVCRTVYPSPSIIESRCRASGAVKAVLISPSSVGAVTIEYAMSCSTCCRIACCAARTRDSSTRKRPCRAAPSRSPHTPCSLAWRSPATGASAPAPSASNSYSSGVAVGRSTWYTSSGARPSRYATRARSVFPCVTTRTVLPSCSAGAMVPSHRPATRRETAERHSRDGTRAASYLLSVAMARWIAESAAISGGGSSKLRRHAIT